MIFIEAPDKGRVHWFCEDDFDSEDGDLPRKIGPQLFTLIRSFVSPNPPLTRLGR